MQARYYDPVIGRFLSNDPVGFQEGGAGYFNRYAYTFNDPVNFTDPTGMAACPGLCGTVRADPNLANARATVTSAASAQLDNAHTALDAAGLAPGVGIVPDAANAALYLARGDLGNAAISGAAMVPVVGQAAGGGRLAAKGADFIEVSTRTRPAKGADGATSEFITERRNGEAISTTHRVTQRNGEVSHQHQDHVGKHGGQRRFPDEWTGTDTIGDPPPADRRTPPTPDL